MTDYTSSRVKYECSRNVIITSLSSRQRGRFHDGHLSRLVNGDKRLQRGLMFTARLTTNSLHTPKLCASHDNIYMWLALAQYEVYIYNMACKTSHDTFMQHRPGTTYTFVYQLCIHKSLFCIFITACILGILTISRIVYPLSVRNNSEACPLVIWQCDFESVGIISSA
jgi:hypothetical protein